MRRIHCSESHVHHHYYYVPKVDWEGTNQPWWWRAYRGESDGAWASKKELLLASVVAASARLLWEIVTQAWRDIIKKYAVEQSPTIIYTKDWKGRGAEGHGWCHNAPTDVSINAFWSTKRRVGSEQCEKALIDFLGRRPDLSFHTGWYTIIIKDHRLLFLRLTQKGR